MKTLKIHCPLCGHEGNEISGSCPQCGICQRCYESPCTCLKEGVDY